MTNQEAKQIVIENTKKAYGAAFDMEACKRALAKEERWMRAAYGSANWVERLGEVGEDAAATFYEDSLKKILPGEKTFNRVNLNAGE